jgi:hypothetical protein
MNNQLDLSNSFGNDSKISTLNDTFLRTFLEQHLAGQTGLNNHVTLVLVVLYVPLFFGGLIGNGLLTLVICARKRFRNITYLLLCSLACADLSGIFIRSYAF